METWHAVVLGVVQGLTEFLPVSSTGHLVITQQLLGIKQEMLAFDAIIHFGSLLAVITVYRQELLMMLRGVVSRGAGEEALQGRRLLIWLVLATLPILIVGFLWRDAIADAFSSPYVASVMLFATGGMLWLAERRQNRDNRVRDSVAVPTIRDALWMGIAQAAAVLPGLSRSGTTLSTGMLLGLSRERAARFSFLMSIPTLLGASLLEAKGLMERPELLAALEPTNLFVGTVVAAASSYAAIALLLRFLRSGRLMPFVYYTFLFGALSLAMTAG